MLDLDRTGRLVAQARTSEAPTELHRRAHPEEVVVLETQHCAWEGDPQIYGAAVTDWIKSMSEAGAAPAPTSAP